MENNVETNIDENIVIYKRYYEASIDLVFEAWSAHEHLSQWWGPDGFTITTKKLDFSEGGTWEFVMHGPDGTDFKNKIQFIEIRKPHFLSYKHMGVDGDTADVNFLSEISFEAAGKGTNLTMKQVFSNKEVLQKLAKKYNAVEGGQQHLNNLAKYLETK